MNLQVNYILPKSFANGPGTRFTIWVQGCSIRCPGCSNTDTWDPSKGNSMPTSEIIKQIDAIEGLNGITITGGEPLDQFEAIHELCTGLKEKRPDLSIFLSSGYSWGRILLKLIKQKEGVNDPAEKIIRYEKEVVEKFMNLVDILCLGPFEGDKICRGEWKGSSNQTVFFRTDLGKKQSKMPIVLKEVFISSKGDSLETGFG
jgi:anaerobic ribonucleoside-triphosphate reductase activating protein